MAKRIASAGTNEKPAKPELKQPVGVARGARSNSVGSGPSEEDIRLRAYHRYLERGGGNGGEVDVWVLAEQELKGKR